MTSPGSEYNFSCQKCPRTFKLQEFYEKHQKVHLLKKQHVCAVCGFVYGAAKGLEGHMESAHTGDSEIDTNTHTNTPPVVRPKTMPTSPVDLSQQIPEMPFFHFLQAQGVLTSADLIKQAQQAMLAQMTSNARAGLNGMSLVPITISAPTSPSPNSSNVPHKLQPNDKSKIPSPAGTGNYKIYDQVPEIQDASDAQQNDSGFFRCTICTREFSGLNSLKKHVPIHTRRVQHKCDTCGYVFGKKEYLLDHMRKHTGEISPVCEVCGQTFNKSLKLKEHLKLHRNTGNDGNLNEYVPYKCHICKQCFSQPEPLGEHLRNAHSETVYKCDMCDATFGDVRGKNHHMYNEHQLDAFHQKCVWCPVCNQGFTRHYNLKVHMYKSHGKEYLENNFSQEELDSLMRPPPGSNTSKPSPSPRKRSDEEIVIPGTPTGVLPISPPLTPKLSPKQQKSRNEDSPTMVPSNSIIPSASILKANLQKTRPGPASLTKPQHYFDQEAQHAMLKCQLCEEKFLRKSDLFIHLKQHGVRVISCQHCEDKFLEVTDLKRHLTSVHGQAADHMKDSQPPQQETQPTRRPGPASRTNAPKENRATPMTSSNLPSHLAAQYQDSPGFPCQQCGKVLMHKQSYVSHMRVIHGDYYGGNKWKGSSVVEMVLGGQQGKMSDENQETLRAQLKEAINNVSRTSPTNNDSHNYNDYKFGLACEFCNKAFTDQAQLDEHIHSKHPNLTKRIQAFKAALGLNDSDEPDTKRIKLDYKEVHKRETDELTNNNNNNNNNNTNNNNNIKNEKEEILQEEQTEHQSKEEEINVDVCEENQSEAPQVIEEEDVEELEVEDEESEDEFQIKDREDDTRYEAIEEEFEFSGEYIKPCYCVLPFVSDEEVESMTKRNIAEYYEQPEEYSEDEEGQMVIDENPPTPENLSFDNRHTPSPASNNNNNFNNNELKINSFGQGFADAINICRKETQIAEARTQPQPQPTHTVKFEPQQPALYYPAFPDFSLPFSLSGLIQKKKAEMAAILAPRLSPKEEHSKLTLDHLAKAALVSKAPLSPAKTDSANNNTAVSEYENQIQNDLWPLDCIKCHSVLTNLDNFNIHMNDHWSDDKCCPVCGLLINSKRFNFKQHLKIHTGEKPFVCQVCSRAFRQKAHMVKHVTTHRSEPRGVADSLYSPGAKPEPRTVSEAMLTYNSGVIPEPRSVPESFQPGVIVQ